jgi:hypothetical protein
MTSHPLGSKDLEMSRATKASRPIGPRERAGSGERSDAPSAGRSCPEVLFGPTDFAPRESCTTERRYAFVLNAADRSTLHRSSSAGTRVSPISASASRTRRELFVLQNLEGFAMYSGSDARNHLQTGEALSPLYSKPL